jgi:hypothetical protein
METFKSAKVQKKKKNRIRVNEVTAMLDVSNGSAEYMTHGALEFGKVGA